MRASVAVVALGIVATFVCPSPTSGTPQAGAERGQAQAEFEALLARVKASDPSVDFLRLRQLYAESRTYTPFADDAEEDMVAAAIEGRADTALRLAREILARNYMNIEAHFAGLVACGALNDTACVTHHAYVARGVLESIRASGDGKTAATAYVVVATPEERAMARVLGVRILSQSLVKEGAHSYDVLTVESTDTKQTDHIYFNVDIALAATARRFGLK